MEKYDITYIHIISGEQIELETFIDRNIYRKNISFSAFDGYFLLKELFTRQVTPKLNWRDQRLLQASIGNNRITFRDSASFSNFCNSIYVVYFS